jgi:hypothetical protein
MTPEADLITPLRSYWGYSAFRPLQERVVRSLLAGHDTCVVMPTGGGKSLCYQLPTVVSGSGIQTQLRGERWLPLSFCDSSQVTAGDSRDSTVTLEQARCGSSENEAADVR